MDDVEVFKALFDTAEGWLLNRGMQQVLGPYNLGINQELGILIDGFDTPPYVMVGHSMPYYDAAIEHCGYRAEQELLAYEVEIKAFSVPRVIKALIDQSGHRVTVRKLRRDEKSAELEILREIFNDAWENNWNFVPFTREEFAATGKELLMLLPADYIQIAEIDGQAVAFLALIPNINEAIADLNGRLFPFGWIKLLWRLKVNSPKTARMALMGVRQKYQHTRFGPALAYLVIKAVLDAVTERGLERAEMSRVLEHNQAVRHMLESVGSQVTKRYRMYLKSLV